MITDRVLHVKLQIILDEHGMGTPEVSNLYTTSSKAVIFCLEFKTHTHWQNIRA